MNCCKKYERALEIIEALRPSVPEDKIKELDELKAFVKAELDQHVEDACP